MEPEAVEIVLLGELRIGNTYIISQFAYNKIDQSGLSS